MQRLLQALALLVTASIAGTAAAGAPLLFRHLGAESGLPQSTVLATLQDRQGFIWLATEDGLARYDGYDVVRFGRDPDDPAGLASSFVWDLAEDAHGDLWLATRGGGVSRWSRRTGRFTTYRHDPADPDSLSSDTARQVLVDRRGQVWIGTVGGGLNRLDPASGRVVRFQSESGREDGLGSGVITALHEDAGGQLWIGTADGLYRLSSSGRGFERIALASGTSPGITGPKVSTIASDPDGTLWIGTFDAGLLRFSPSVQSSLRTYRAGEAARGGLASDEVRAILRDGDGRLWVGGAKGLDLLADDGQVTRYTKDPTDPASLADDYVMSLYQDRAGLLWVGTRAGGVSRWNPRSWLFGHRRPDWLDGAYVMSFAEGPRGRLWIGTLGGGLHRYDPATKAHQRLESLLGGSPGLDDPRVMSLLADRAGNLWIGTMSGGLARLAPDLRLAKLRAAPEDPDALSADGIMAMIEATNGTIWIGTYGGGVNVLDPVTLTVRRIPYDPREPGSLSAPRATALAQDGAGFMWVGTEGGGLNLLDPAGAVIAVFRHEALDPSSLPADSIYALHVDSRGRVWVGTDGGGLALVEGSAQEPGTLRFRVHSKASGLPSDVVYGIREDGAGRLWLSTSAGLARFDTGTGAVQAFHREHGLQGEEFQFGSHFETADGRLLFGGANGFNWFDPAQLDRLPGGPRVVLTRAEVMNAPASTSVPHVALDRLTLAHDETVVSFEFAALDFTAPAKNRYSYRLAGFDAGWVDIGTRRQVSYTNLAAGDYVLEVRAVNSDGVWSPEPLRLPITVEPAPWATWWARLLYGVLAVLLALTAWQVHRRKLQQAQLQQQRLEREVAERTAELRERNEALARANRAKSDFLSRMSHEIRTPMNGVIGMTDLLRHTALSGRQAQLASTIDTSARSLLQILNEILDHARVESGQLRLEAVEFDLRELLEEAALTFSAAAEAKGLELVVSPPPGGTTRVVGDPLRLRQVLQNLVGNALKFTATGEITVTGTIRQEGPGPAAVGIEVRDTGIGMSADTLRQVFEPFAQADETTTRRFGGTGLGLAICRQLAELMGGSIEASSKTGEGSTFLLRLSLPVVRRADAATLPLAGMRASLACRGSGLAAALRRQLEAWGMVVRDGFDANRQDPAGDARRLEVWIVDADSVPQIVDALQPDGARLESPAAVVIAGTAAAASQRLEQRFGPDLVVPKPVRHESLLRAVCRAAGCPLPQLPSVPVPAATAQARLSGHVLVVEDNPVNAAVAEGMLAELGCTSATVASGREAVARARGERFDLILMDLHMPDFDGLEATRLIRRGSPGTDPPILALTADVGDGPRDLCLAAGMSGYLSKPFTMAGLHAALAPWLPAVASGPGAVPRTRPEIIDPEALARIRALESATRPGLVARVVSLYLNGLAAQLDEIDAALARGDLAAVREVGHALKSASANVGASEVARLAEFVERAGRDGDAGAARDLLGQLRLTAPSVSAALGEDAFRATA